MIYVIVAVHPAQQAEPMRISPWFEESDQLPPSEHRFELTVSLELDQINRFDPLIVRVTLTNRDSNALTTETRKDGAPYTLASLVARGDGPFERHHQWLMRSSPEYRDRDLRTTLQTGESTSGEFLILFGGPPTGLPFAEPGRYRVRVACQPDAHFAPVYSNEVIVTVSRDLRGNATFLNALDDLYYVHNQLDREWVTRDVGKEYHVGMEVLQKVIRQGGPDLLTPTDDPQYQREVELAKSLAVLLKRFPESTYSGYIARYLGSGYRGAYGRQLGKEEANSWIGTARPPNRDIEEMKSRPAYKDALRYLTMAAESDLWPRALSTQHLTGLHITTRDWAKAMECINILRTKYKESDGFRIADELEAQMKAYQADLTKDRP